MVPNQDNSIEITEHQALFSILPSWIEDTVRQLLEHDNSPTTLSKNSFITNTEDLLEIILDLGRPAEARFLTGDIYLSDRELTRDDLAFVQERIGSFGGDNRAGIERTLHRISAMRNRKGEIVGLTCRFGRAVEGSANVVEDLALSGKSILLVGRPGVGKTTILRELARILSDSNKRVIIVDTSNEIAGDGDIPHPAIGKARRMQVPTPAMQHATMIEAVENHMPEVIVVDEMGTELEAAAARTIAERGVQLVATAHGNTLENLLVNPTLSDLVGGIQTVTLGDDEARRRRTQKTILERKAPPTFDVLIEIIGWNNVAVHEDVARTVDAVLRGKHIPPEIRELDNSGTIRKHFQQVTTTHAFDLAPFTFHGKHIPRQVNSNTNTPMEEPPMKFPPINQVSPPEVKLTKILPFGVSRERLEDFAHKSGASINIVNSLDDADVILTTKSHFRKKARLIQDAEEKRIPIFVLRRNTPGQLANFLEQFNGATDLGASRVNQGSFEAEDGVYRILSGETYAIELEPQSAYVRKMQHRIAEQAQLHSHSIGRDPHRRVTIRRPR
tara:strand:- start:2148 stop:3821 length:1674 start_codon:yes stop_codon:yes gene_type:complete